MPDTGDASARTGRSRQDLGRLGELADWLAGVQDRFPPVEFARIRVVVVSDLGATPANEGPDTQAQVSARAADIVAGGGSVGVAARAAGATVRVVDPGVTDGAVDGALDLGRAIADAEVDAGADLLVFGVIGRSHLGAAAALTAVLTDSEPVAVVDRRSGSDADWSQQIAVVRGSLRCAHIAGNDLAALLGCCPSPTLAVLTGLLSQAAQRRTPVLLDGLVTCAAGLLAERMSPGSARWWLAGSRSPEPGQTIALARLGLTPLLDLGLRLEDGTGALLAVPLLTAAAMSVAAMSVAEPDTGAADSSGDRA